MLTVDMAERDSAEDAVEGTEFPKKYVRICDSRTAFMKAASRSTQPPDLDNLMTEMRSSDAAAEALDVGLLSWLFIMVL